MKSAEIDKINKTKDDIAKMEKNNEILIKDNQNLLKERDILNKEKTDLSNELEQLQKEIKELNENSNIISTENNDIITELKGINVKIPNINNLLNQCMVSISMVSINQYQLSPDEYEEYDLLRKNKDENDALILQLKSNNKAKEVEKQELKEILKNLTEKK